MPVEKVYTQAQNNRVQCLEKMLTDCILYVWYLLKLYMIGIIALFCQMFEKYRKPVKVPKLARLAGKTAVVTGGAAGIGYHISQRLVCLGARVIIACRSQGEAESAIAQIKQEYPTADVFFMELDLASFQSVKTFVSEFLSKDWPLHILINNAGVMLVPFHLTEDGYEYHLQVNFLSHALLITLLKDKMAESPQDDPKARIVNVSSIVHKVASYDPTVLTEKQENNSLFCYSPHNAYAVSKLLILLYTYALSRQWAKDKLKVTINAIHPGVINTSLYHNVCQVDWYLSWLWKIFQAVWSLKPLQCLYLHPWDSADAIAYLAAAPDLEERSGDYFSCLRKTVSSTTSLQVSLQEDVYRLTNKILEEALHGEQRG